MPRTALTSLTSRLVRRRAQDLAGRLDADAPTGPGAELVEELRATGTALSQSVVPPEDFRAALRTRLLAVAAVQADSAPAAAPVVAAPVAAAPGVPAPAGVPWRRGTRVGSALAGALAGVVAVSGVAVAGSQSLPGDPFYGVKRTTEALSLRLSDGELDQGTRRLQLASTRLDELRGLVLGRGAADDDGVPPAAIAAPRTAAADGPLVDRVRDTLTDMDERTTEGQSLLNDVFRDDRDQATLVTLTRWATRQSQRLEALVPLLPAPTQDRARLSLSLVTGVEVGAEQLLDPGACAPTAPPCGRAPLLPSPPSGTAPSAPTPATQPGPAAPGLPGPVPAPGPTTAPVAPGIAPSPPDAPAAPAPTPAVPLFAPQPVPSLPSAPPPSSPLPVPLQPPTLQPLPSLPPLLPAPGG